ncbi:D-amino acid dehydrogenase [Massilia sp. PAMC28688]|uniref:D-amino acid dehydrogenase n=1 Tax=Massilia sp. PAMC28688 TaxID=2861283 RepID=UPI001C63096B|nr:D-amino acid dehydrogenase [Massilia sp. PAMC28688]QYF95908.1 D-amino acid dehydrogenase [Massilia sp. PAMC28688]
MKIIVLGSGVIGTTSAYFLARAGHEVTVVERQSGAGMETSFANAGEISPGMAAPWAAPGIPLRALKWLAMRDGPLVVRARFDPTMWRWMRQMLANCNVARYEVNKARMVRLAEYSRDCLVQLRADTGIAYDERSRGTLQVFRDQRQVDEAAHDVAVLERYGVPYALLDPAACEQVEPALARVRGRIVGGLRLPGDETGDCFKFTQALAAMAQQEGVQFRQGVDIRGLQAAGGAITGVMTSEGEMTADAYVMAMGSYSPLLLKPLGVQIPVFPVKGYSITMPIKDAGGAPESTVMDETFKVGITRLGERIRVGGTAELAGYDLRLRQERRAPLVRAVTDLFPHGGDLAQASFWCGLRPMTPDGTPVIGATPYRNLYLNTGHGTLGWTMSCGSARVLADLVSGKQPDISLDGLTLARYA